MQVIVEQLPLAPISFLADKVNESDKTYFDDDAGMIIDASGLYINHETEKILLNRTLASIRKKAAFEQITSEYHSLHDAAINMVNYFTHLAPAQGELPLLSKCLLSGINAFNEAHRQSYFSNDPSIKMAAFINGASSHFHEILLNNIYGQHEDSWVQWKPLTEPIMNWILRYQFQKLLIVPTSTKVSAVSFNAASNKLLYEIFTFADLSFCGISSTTVDILLGMNAGDSY